LKSNPSVTHRFIPTDRDGCQADELFNGPGNQAGSLMSTRTRLSSKNSSTGTNDLLPSEFYLSQNYPNPFRETTTIKFCVAYRTKVKLEVADLEGKIVGILLDEQKEPGTYEIEFDASTLPSGGRGLSEGIYIYKLQAGDFLSEKKMTLLR
jgi:hypothetical protein